MLIGISPLLGPDLLHALRAMGHGDEIAFVDGNYPAAEHARRLIRADGIALEPMLRAVLGVFPVEAAYRAALEKQPQSPRRPTSSSSLPTISGTTRWVSPVTRLCRRRPSTGSLKMACGLVMLLSRQPCAGSAVPSSSPASGRARMRNATLSLE